MALTDYYNLIALAVFVVFAIFVPVSFILMSVALRSKRQHNNVKGMPYESGETPIGSGRDIVNEYLPFFIIFLPFEMIAILLALWAIASRSMGLATNILVIGLAVFTMLFALVAYRFTSERDV